MEHKFINLLVTKPSSCSFCLCHAWSMLWSWWRETKTCSLLMAYKTQYWETLSFQVSGSEMLQILHSGNSHWVTINTVETSHPEGYQITGGYQITVTPCQWQVLPGYSREKSIPSPLTWFKLLFTSPFNDSRNPVEWNSLVVARSLTASDRHTQHHIRLYTNMADRILSRGLWRHTKLLYTCTLINTLSAVFNHSNV